MNKKVTTILIVDDSRVSRMMSRQFILNMHPDWVVEESGSAEEALVELDTLRPDLIVLDVNMPGMGGLAAVEKLREKSPASHISLMTANVQDAVRNKASELGIGFVEKPITDASIRKLIAVLENR